MQLLSCFYAFVTALSAALIMVPVLRRWALDRGTVDLPDERKVHAIPTPRLGGIAIFLSFLFAALIFAPDSRVMRGILAGALVVFTIGIADDLEGLTSRQKFAGQILATLVAVAVSGMWLARLGDPLGLGEIVLPPWAAIPFTVFAVVGVTNAINLIDGLDGLAGGISVLALGAYGLIGLLDGDLLAPVLAAALAGAILGFLKYNFFPARIFMGDTGSLTVGFVLAFLAVNLTQRPDTHFNVVVPVVVLGLPVFDALWVMGRRLRYGTSPFAADRSHLHHKLLNLGFGHRFTVLAIYAVSLFWACSALLLHDLPEYALLAYLVGTAVGFYLLLRYLLRHRARYAFLGTEGEGGLRESVLYNRCCDVVERFMLLVPVILALYALMGGHGAFTLPVKVWPVALLLCLVGLGMRRWGGGGDFQLLVVYAATCLLAFLVWKQTDPLLAGFSPKRLGDALLAVVALLVVFKIVFRRIGEFFLGTVDFLALALMIFLSIAAQQPQLIGMQIGGPLVRAILLMLAARTVASRGPAYRRRLVAGTLVLLAVFAVSGLR
ncbi:MAG: undecaprenyl/decaprenyl-phosphate alpha-N-acetylglucosaminyl 1-phosphate transferase [Deltaproteobacteria bacterium]|nr:MAG: undecaprenyl/decaprenyl-phosphate alpha-N-acetylglucosaminyl 1-phosphate transferase [Deltaproteobacteria bacterium]